MKCVIWVLSENLSIKLMFYQSRTRITRTLRDECGPGSVVGYSGWLRAGRSGDRIPVGTRFSTPVETGPWAHPASCAMGTGFFSGVKSSRGMTLTPHPLLVPWSWKGRAIPLLPLWAVQPVQSLSACTRVHFTFTLRDEQHIPHNISLSSS